MFISRIPKPVTHLYVRMKPVVPGCPIADGTKFEPDFSGIKNYSLCNKVIRVNCRTVGTTCFPVMFCPVVLTFVDDLASVNYAGGCKLGDFLVLSFLLHLLVSIFL